MNRISPEQIGHKTLFEDLGLIVGLEQGCNISASEAYKTAHDLSRKGVEERDIYIIDEDPTQHLKGKVTYLKKVVAIGDEAAELCVVTPRRMRNLPVAGRNLLLRKVVKQVSSEVTDDPYLCARIGENSFLPLARFSANHDSQFCSYVQIGTEMKDETVLMTSMDNGTSRQDIVEAIRTVFDEGDTHADSFSKINDSKSRGIVQKLASQQAEKHNKAIDEAQEAMLARLCHEKISSNCRKEYLYFINEEEGQTYWKDSKIRTLLEAQRTEDERFVELAVVQERGDENVKIVAINRGVIALTIATVVKDTSKVVFQENKYTEDQGKHKSLIKLLQRRARGKNIFQLPPRKTSLPDNPEPSSITLAAWKGRKRNSFGGVDLTEEDYTYDSGSYYHTIAATLLYDYGLLHKNEGWREKKVYERGMTIDGVNEMKWRLQKLLYDPENYGLEGDYSIDSPPVWLALMRVPQKRKAVQKFYDELGVTDTLNRLLPNPCIEEERFVSMLQSLNKNKTSRYSGTIDRINTGTNDASLDVQADIEKEGTIYTIEFRAKAHAVKTSTYPEEPYRTFKIDIASPLLSEPGATRQEVVDKLEILSNTLKALSGIDN